MFISQVHTHMKYLFVTLDITSAKADGDTFCSSVRYRYIHHIHTPQKHSIFNTQDNTDVTADGDTSCSSVRYTHIRSIFNTQDSTDATTDGDTSCSSVKYRHTYNLCLILKIKQTPWQMELHHVHQSGTHTHTLSLNFDILQTPRQIEIHRVHQSGTHAHTTYTHHTPSLFNTQDNTDVTVDGDTSCSSVRYIHTSNISLLLQIIQAPTQMEIHHVYQSGTHTHINSL